MRCNKTFRALLSVILIFTFVIVSFSGVSANTNSLQKQKNELLAQQKSTEAEINRLKNSMSSKEDLKKALNSQIAVTQKQISLYNQQITDCNKDIEDINVQIVKKEDELEEAKNLYKQRLRSIYMSGGSAASVSILASSDDMADLLAKYEMTKCASAYDQTLSKKLNMAINEINQAKSTVEQKKTELSSAKQEMATKQNELTSQMSEINGIISELNSDVKTLNSEYAKRAAALKDIEKKISDANSTSGGITYSGEKFAWPVPSTYRISSGYGWRTWSDGSREYHKGIDISNGKYGVPIVAAADGVVTVATSNGNGYGNYVTINHGASSDGKLYMTLYGHMQNYAVRVGQSVKRGQTIGYIGSTGWSTGPHVHFEVRVNGSTVNPMSFYN